MPHSNTVPVHSRFAMPHALVIATCIVTAAILAPRDEMTVADVLLLIGGAGGIGAAIVMLVMTGNKRVSRIDRFVRAYRSSGN
jgi:NADPH:quinone reductase-like Zn-dependent oxidoreductase